MKELVIDEATTVNEVVLRNPASLRVLSSFGIDTCCGGALPIGEVAKRHGIELEMLLDRIREASD